MGCVSVIVRAVSIEWNSAKCQNVSLMCSKSVIIAFFLNCCSLLPTTASISCSSCSSTCGFCLRSRSMKKRLRDRVSGAAITISSTHCVTSSADSSPWFWKHSWMQICCLTLLGRRKRNPAFHLQRGTAETAWKWKNTSTTSERFYFKWKYICRRRILRRLTCANMSSAVKLMSSSLSACSIFFLFWSTRCLMASCNSWLWDNR